MIEDIKNKLQEIIDKHVVSNKVLSPVAAYDECYKLLEEVFDVAYHKALSDHNILYGDAGDNFLERMKMVERETDNKELVAKDSERYGDSGLNQEEEY